MGLVKKRGLGLLKKKRDLGCFTFHTISLKKSKNIIFKIRNNIFKKLINKYFIKNKKIKVNF
jgi:ribosomal protein S17